MQKIVNLVSKAIKQFELIKAGDSVAVAISGGKDSLVLLEILSRIRKYFNLKFNMIAITISLKFYGVYDNFSEIAKLCETYEVPYFVEKSEIAEIVFDARKEKSACSLCSTMRRGLINIIAKKKGCNKVAFGHNSDDVVETVLMNLFSAGKFGCFSPKTFLSRQNIVQIRPLVFVSEEQTTKLAKKLKLPVIQSRCYVDGRTNRELIKKFLNNCEKQFKDVKKLVFGALLRSGLNGWHE